MWVFGYGSVIWKPAFEFIESVPATLCGYTRRFWQGSPDHRGTPEEPGRVVTLVPDLKGLCHGLAFHVETSKEEAVIEQLDIRESGGYERCWLEVNTQQGPLQALTYIAAQDNANFLGEAPLEEIVAQVHSACGQSGRNTEYVLELDRALRAHGVVDEHVRELGQALKELSKRGG